MFAKYISETEIEIAPKNKGRWSNYNQNIELMKADGYREVKVIEQTSKDKPKILYRINKDIIEQYAMSLSSQELATVKREERDKAINDIIWRIQRYEQQKYLNIKTTDDDATYMNILNYVQYLRDIPNMLLFPSVKIQSFDEWLDAKIK